jgi:hypothetical protein
MTFTWLRGLEWRRELVTFAILYLSLLGLAVLLDVPRTRTRVLGDVAILVALRLLLRRWFPGSRAAPAPPAQS